MRKSREIISNTNRKKYMFYCFENFKKKKIYQKYCLALIIS